MDTFEKKKDNFFFKINKSTQDIRTKFYKPFLHKLTAWGLTPNGITNLRLFAGVVFIYLFYKNPFWASIFILIVILSDTVDGSLARHQGVASDQGKFLDILVDRIIHSLILITLIPLGASTYLVLINMMLMPIVHLLAMIKINEFKKSDWIIHPFARSSYISMWPVIAFFAFFFLSADYLNLSLWLSNILGVVVAVYYYIYIQLRWAKKHKQANEESTS